MFILLTSATMISVHPQALTFPTSIGISKLGMFTLDIDDIPSLRQADCITLESTW